MRTSDFKSSTGARWQQLVQDVWVIKTPCFFETGTFDVRSGIFGQVLINDPKQKGSWNVNIANDVNGFQAHGFRGVEVSLWNIGGLFRPIFDVKLKYAPFDRNGNHQGMNIGNWSAFATNPNILVYWATEARGRFGSDEVFSTTIHETCHSTHAALMNGNYIQFSQVSEAIAESWPVAVEWFITQMEYRERGIANYADPTYSVTASYPIPFGYQYWPFNSSAEYSSVFIDVVDDFNQIGRLFIFPNGASYVSPINDQ